ncbi:MAG: NCS2 family permease, partial [Tannerellaceae bacterium]|nr:NCS2 family permease [Tannerellaceae bacterium]
YSIADGMIMGLLSYVLVKLLSGKYKEITIPMYILAALFILNYLFI